MAKGVTYIDYILVPKDKLREELVERLNKMQEIIKKVEEKNAGNDKILIKDSTLAHLKETFIIALNYLAVCNSSKVDEYKKLIFDKLAYIRENKLLTLAQYKEAYQLLGQILAI